MESRGEVCEFVCVCGKMEDGGFGIDELMNRRKDCWSKVGIFRGF